MRFLYYLFINLIFLTVACHRSTSDDSVVDLDSAATEMPAVLEEAESKVHDVTDAEAQQVTVWLRDDLLRDDLDFLKPEERYFSLDKFDLNDDGVAEFFIGFANDYFCGSGGCTYYIVDQKGGVHGRFTVSYAPFRVLASKTHGWHDLLIDSSSGTHELQYDGHTYPSNLSELPALSMDSIPESKLVARVLVDRRPDYSF